MQSIPDPSARPSFAAADSTRVHSSHITALVIADDSAVEEWITCLVRRAFPSVHCFVARSPQAALQILATQTMSFAFVDPNLGGGAGIRLIGQVVQATFGTRCVAMSNGDEHSLAIAAFSAGAKGFVINDQPADFLVEQLRQLTQGFSPLSPTIARQLVRHFAYRRTAYSSIQHDDAEALTAREEDVMRLVAKGMSIMGISGMLHISGNTVSSHLKNIYRKRKISSRAEAALEARRLSLA